MTRGHRLPGLERGRHAQADDARLAAKVVVGGVVEEEREPRVLADEDAADGCASQRRRCERPRTADGLVEDGRAGERVGFDDVRGQTEMSVSRPQSA